MVKKANPSAYISHLITNVLLLFLALNLSGQITIQGHVLNNNGEGIERINILIYASGGETLASYAVSDSSGYFKTDFTAITDSLDIEVSSVHYRNEYLRVSNTSQDLLFRLQEEVMQLETITIKAPPIVQKGDTITFLVSSFAGKEDKAIEDVLRRMPGIEVEPGGRILYQGVPLQKFYVEGLDLMDGRYGMVSKNLPHNAVSEVEVLENHQPLRILEDRVSSQQASLNLKLKRDITATGTAELGAGLYPFLWDVNITPMVFTKNFQVVASYQTNNTGNDVGQQTHVLTIQDYIRNIDRPAENPSYFYLQNLNLPQIEKSRYLDNNIHLLNFNGLQKIGKNLQLRANVFYVNDYQNQNETLRRTYYNLTDTLTFFEENYIRKQPNYLQGNFTLSRNVKTNFLKNDLKIQSNWDGQKGLVFIEGNGIEQSFRSPLKSISNELRSVNPLGKYLVEFQSFISYSQSPHSLQVMPGQFEHLLNQGEPYEKTHQQIELKRFFADHSAGFVFNINHMTFTPRVGIAYRRQVLESSIDINNGVVNDMAGPGFENEMDGRHTRLYGETKIEYSKSGLTLKAELPLSWQIVTLSDIIWDSTQHINRVFFDPSLSADYKISALWRIRGRWGYASNLDDIDRVHDGFILRNYRTFDQNAAPLSVTRRNNISLFLSYRNPVNAFFNSLSYVFTVANNNLLYRNVVQDDGTVITQSFVLPNKIVSHSFQLKTSKFIAATKTTVRLQAAYNQRGGKSWLNGELFNTINHLYFIKPGLNTRITKWLNAEYEFDANIIQTYVEKERKSNITMLKHHLSAFAFPADNQLISLSSEYYNHEGTQNLFVDLLYRYTIKKKKIDIEIKWNNIFNNKTYTSYQASSLMVWESTYFLRPSQLFLSVRFSL